MKHLRVPTLFISGMADTLVPPRMMSELYNSCRSIRKQLLQIPDGTHNETWTAQGYYHSVAVFLHNCRIHTEEKDDFSNKIDISKFESSVSWNNVQNI
jgi:fermentation-respiration switch protein FrsA (DUF1100 family)